MKAMMICAVVTLLSGCLSHQYTGIQISSTDQLSFTRVVVNGNTVVLCQVGE